MASSTGSGEDDYGLETYPSLQQRDLSVEFLPGLRTVQPVKDDWELRYERAVVTIRELRELARQAREQAWRATQQLNEIRAILHPEK